MFTVDNLVLYYHEVAYDSDKCQAYNVIYKEGFDSYGMWRHKCRRIRTRVILAFLTTLFRVEVTQEFNVVIHVPH